MTDFQDRLQLALGEHYSVQRELGRGGMARVFLAEERHPLRRVAIKVLDPELAAILGPERFLREVDLASNLMHPHILPIFVGVLTRDGSQARVERPSPRHADRRVLRLRARAIG